MGPPSDSTPFELAPAVYDSLVDWERRLEREGPFFRETFETAGTRTVLDIACGTGHHAARFSDWGLDVTGLDASEEMISYCRSLHGETDRLRWRVQRLEELSEMDGQFDAITCLGNSLSLLPSFETADAAIENIGRLLSTGGMSIVHVLNCWRLPDGPIQWQKCRPVSVGGIDRVLLKGVHRAGSRAFVDIAIHDCDGDAPTLDARSTPLLVFEVDSLLDNFRDAGCTDVSTYGDHSRTPFDRAASMDLIIAAGKPCEPFRPDPD